MSISCKDIIQRYDDLTRLVDTHVAGVQAKMSECINCRKGCATCCDRDSLTSIEAWKIYEYSLENDIIPNETVTGCPFLCDSACIVYEVRPLICRSHGIPVKTGEYVHCCELNFAEIDNIEATMILDQDLVDHHLGILDLAFCQIVNDTFFRHNRIKFTDLASYIHSEVTKKFF